jgi:hypothetical protein
MDAARCPSTGVEGIGSVEDIGGSLPMLLGRLSVFGRPQPKGCHKPSPAPPATQPAVEPEEAATDELAVEHVTSSTSTWSESSAQSESSTMSMVPTRSMAQYRFLRRVGRTETEESQLEMDCSLAVHDEELLRAVPASAILGCSGRAVMGSSQGCEGTFSLSRPVLCMHYFVSHSWQTPAWMKMVCLMYEMNACRAVVAAIATHIVMGGLQTAGLWNFDILPPGVLHFEDGQQIHVVLLEAHWVISCLVFFLVLGWGQAIPVCESLCFLDKCCIHQTDSIKKAAGIKQLGAFLRNSEYLLVLWQPEYLTRLWCIYELAAFSHVNRGSCDRVLIRPLKVYIFAAAYCVAATIFQVIAYLASCTMYSNQHAVVRAMPGEGQQLLYYYYFVYCSWILLLPLPCVMCWKVFEWHVNDLKTLRTQLSEFRIVDTECHVAEDRTFVLGQIAEWFGSADEFDTYVRTTLHSRVEKLLQDRGPIPYGTVLVMSVPNFLLTASGSLTALSHGDTEYMWRWLLISGIVLLCANAIIVHLGLRLADTSIREETEGSSLFKRKLAGPLLLVGIISIVLFVSAIFFLPWVPLWHGPILFVAAAAVTALCYKRDWWHRASARLPCLCATFSRAERRPEHTVNSGPITDGSHGSSGSRPLLPRELHEAR